MKFARPPLPPILRLPTTDFLFKSFFDDPRRPLRLYSDLSTGLPFEQQFALADLHVAQLTPENDFRSEGFLLSFLSLPTWISLLFKP